MSAKDTSRADLADAPSADDTDDSRTDAGKVDPYEDGPSRYEVFRKRIGRNKTVDFIYRAIVTVVGFAIIIGGIALLPLPGPGWLIIFLGLGLLATEYEWSRRLLDYAQDRVRQWVDWVQSQSLFVRALLGLATAALIVGLIVAYIWWSGVPGWFPDWVPLVDSLPTRG